MTPNFFEKPILNSPYEMPRLHHALDHDGQPTDAPPVQGRRRSELITPVPKPRKKKKPEQGKLALGDKAGISTEEQEYNPTPIINEIRSHVASWRDLPNAADWGVTPATARLLAHWRSPNYESVRPFFCQVEAVETIIWLTEVARREKRYEKFWEHLKGANEQSNPELLRIAMKMATGSGKTTVMAMLMAWQTVNAVRSPTSSLFSRGFLIVTPGITIRDRLRVLLPDDPDNYYRTRELVPPDMLGEIAKAKIVITNYHAFKRRETMDLSKVGRALLQGRGEAPETIETEGQMLQRACGELMALKNVVVINDEAHHCYREKPDADDEEDLKGEEKDEAKKNNEAARLWINGLEALKRKVGVRAVYDLSATPFFLRGSGYAEGTLFPWTVSDFSLMDAIECGIVKLPRVPVADNMIGKDMPVYRDLWAHIGKEMPKKGRGKSGELDPLNLPNELQTAMHALYGHYAQTYELWKQEGISVPPVFIVVCNNTSTSQLVYEWISGWERIRDDDDERQLIHKGHLDLFRNYDEYGNRLARPNTLLIDSEQLESGEALDANFREIAGPEIEQFKREMIQRSGAGEKAAENISDSDLLREVMNTIGREGRLTVTPFRGVAEELYQLAFGRRPHAPSDKFVRDALAKASADLGVTEFTARFLNSEWTNVIDAWQLTSADDYAEVPRLGRKNRIGAKQRARLWPVFAAARKAINDRGFHTWAQIFAEVTAYYAGRERKPFTHIVVDEAQDLGVPELRLLAAIAPPGLDALFFAGDLGQRIFQQPFSWAGLGIDVRGRSQTLKVNYRTSHQIRRAADQLLPKVVRDVDGLEEERFGTVSVFNGPDPVVAIETDAKAEIARVSHWISEAVTDGIKPSEIGLFVRTRDQLDRARAAVRGAGQEVFELSERGDDPTDQISIGTMHMAKGLEFKAVAVMACDDEVLPLQARIESVADEVDLDDVYETERQLLYVSCTRARDRLLVSGATPGSEFLNDLK